MRCLQENKSNASQWSKGRLKITGQKTLLPWDTDLSHIDDSIVSNCTNKAKVKRTQDYPWAYHGGSSTRAEERKPPPNERGKNTPPWNHREQRLFSRGQKTPLSLQGRLMLVGPLHYHSYFPYQYYSYWYHYCADFYDYDCCCYED